MNAGGHSNLLNDRVIPFYEEHDIPLQRVLTDRGTEFAEPTTAANTSLIVSDIARDIPPPPNERAGLDMLAAFRKEGIALPVIFYVGSPKPGAGTPPDALGLTHRPDILLTLVGEALERTRRK